MPLAGDPAHVRRVDSKRERSRSVSNNQYFFRKINNRTWLVDWFVLWYMKVTVRTLIDSLVVSLGVVVLLQFAKLWVWICCLISATRPQLSLMISDIESYQVSFWSNNSNHPNKNPSKSWSPTLPISLDFCGLSNQRFHQTAKCISLHICLLIFNGTPWRIEDRSPRNLETTYFNK